MIVKYVPTKFRFPITEPVSSEGIPMEVSTNKDGTKFHIVS
jgi:hypothetical protein